MPPDTNSEEVFISYTQESVEHSQRVLRLSNRLRKDGIDCVLDQYEESPPEGWPRWMDKKIRDARYVLVVCTESYYRRVMGEEKEGVGLGIRWEGNLIYQHLYNAGTMNNKFIPVVFVEKDKTHIPTPLQGTSHYSLQRNTGYEDLYRRLTNQPKTEKPKLGKRRSVPPKEVKTDPTAYLTMPIDVDLWNAARWQGTAVLYVPGRPPVLALAYRNEEAARKIFEGWHKRYGDNDEYEELRISIVEGPIKGEGDGYTVHVGPDPEAFRKRLKDAGYGASDDDLYIFVSRINRMNPKPGSQNLENFKHWFRQHKTYFLAPAVLSADREVIKPLFDLGIYKSKIHFRHVSEIREHDVDAVVLNTGEVQRPKNIFNRTS
jgi:SEFIR domain